MTTLVISDLHLGSRGRADVLREQRLRDPLLAALGAGIERLILLGDVVELRGDPVGVAFAAAEPVLREIGEALGPDAEIVIVPGNHDHHLLAPWRARGGGAGADPGDLERAVDWRDREPLVEIANWLGPSRVRAAYPAVWLRDDVLAMHGHYVDAHTSLPQAERLAAGMMRRVRGLASPPRGVEEHEAVLAPLYAWIHEVAQTRAPAPAPGPAGPAPGSAAAHPTPTMAIWDLLQNGRTLRSRALAGAFPAAVYAMRRMGLGELRADISPEGIRRAGLRAAGEALTALDAAPAHLVFGHTHRAGPLAGDDRAEWVTPGGTRLHNCGCWVLEPGFVAGTGPRSPYWPGRAVEVGAEGPPRLRSLLDAADLPALSRPPRRSRA